MSKRSSDYQMAYDTEIVNTVPQVPRQICSPRAQKQALQILENASLALGYLRVSTRGQAERGGGADEGFSIPAQREANKRKALSMGAMVGKEFVDRGASAKSADRPDRKSTRLNSSHHTKSRMPSSA